MTGQTARGRGFVIQGRLPSLNDYVTANRSHWSKGAAFKRRVEEDIIWQIKAAGVAPAAGPVTVSFEWHESDKRRDLDNIFSAKKYILDAMQKAGIIVNDNRKCIRGLTDTLVDDKTDFVRVTMQAAE